MTQENWGRSCPVYVMTIEGLDIASIVIDRAVTVITDQTVLL